MPKKACDIVDGIGISHHLPANPKYFTELSVCETISLPCEKPDIGQLLSIMVDTKVTSLSIANTPESTSTEGQSLSGKKLTVELIILQKFKYVSDDPYQKVYALHHEKLLSLFVIVPRRFNKIPIETLLRENRVNLQIYIEDISGKTRNKRTILGNITLLADVTIKPSSARVSKYY